MIEVRGLCVEAGDFRLRDVSLAVGPGEYFVLLGPTGSGKTVFVSCLCGLIRAAGGTIEINGRDVTDLEPRLRRVGYVPQDGGLFPHMTVARNLTFSLRVRGVAHDGAMKRILPLVESLRLGPLLARSPSSLSGGERQMVAVGRALAARPELLVLDEPVSALDGPARRTVCSEIRRVHEGLKVPSIHVCHNLDEALALADRAAIIDRGRLVQTGTMAELMARPRSEAVARLLGAENIFSGTAVPRDDGQSLVVLAGRHIYIPGRHEGAVKFMVRPELARIVTGEPQTRSAVRAVLVRVEPRGPYKRLEFDAGIRIVVYVQAGPGAGAFEPGRELAIEFPDEAIYVFPGVKPRQTAPMKEDNVNA